MNNFGDLMSDSQLEQLASDEDATVSIKIPLRETQPIQPALASKKNAILGRIKKKRTQQLAALTNLDGPTSPIIRADQVSPSGLTIQDIYQNAGLGTESDEGFNVFRVEKMLDDTSIIELDDRAKEAAVVMALKTHNVQLSSVLDDGRDHQLALEAHDLRFQDELDKMNSQLETENSRLHAEIERYANPRIERMEANQKRVEDLQATYDQWRENKDFESQRLDKMLNRWTAGKPNIVAPKAITARKPKRETEPLPFFGEESGPDFLQPVVLTPSELDIDLIHQQANTFGESKVLRLDQTSAVLDADINASQPSEVDLTFETKLKSKRNIGDLGYYTWVFFAVFLWFLGGVTLATMVETMKPIAALGLSFGIPLGAALLMAMISKGHGRWAGYFAFLGYFGLVISVIAHLDVDNLAKLLSQDPVWLTEGSNLDGTMIVLPDFLASGLTALSNLYADFLYWAGFATKL